MLGTNSADTFFFFFFFGGDDDKDDDNDDDDDDDDDDTFDGRHLLRDLPTLCAPLCPFTFIDPEIHKSQYSTCVFRVSALY